MEIFVVNGDVWNNSLGFLIHQLLGTIHLESILCLRRNQFGDLHKQKLKTVPE